MRIYILGKGMSGRFTLPGMKRKGKKRKRIIKDEDDEKAMDEHEYKPVKNARYLVINNLYL